jgi:radical SAM protein with 4Fe4S-binding SPASM domain
MDRPPPIEEISQEQYWSALSERGAQQKVPVHAMIELTYGCNLRCVHCYNPTHQAKDELVTTQIKALIDQLAEAGCLEVAFTGGEIFTRRDLFEILAYAQAKGFAITLLTHATLITPERADRIQAIRPHRVEISIYGATQETYERVTRIPGSFQAFVTGVQLLCERAVSLLIKMPVMTLNQHEVQQAKALIESWGIKFVYSTEIFPRVDGSLEPLQYRLAPHEVVRIDDAMLVSSRRRAEGGGENVKSCPAREGLFTCMCGKNSLAVTPYGRMNLCVSLPVPQYDLGSGTVAKGWKTLVDLVDRANAIPGDAYECPSCPVQSHCRQGPMDAWLETRRLDPCLPYFKELATLDRHLSESVQAREAGGRDQASSAAGSPSHPG